MLYQLLRLFLDIIPFLNVQNSCPAISANIWRITDDPEQLKRLRLQLAITTDEGKLLVKKTYLMEGDGEQIVEANSHLQKISTAAALEHYPQTAAVAAELDGGDDAEVRALMTQAKACVAPAVEYFRTKFNKQGTPCSRKFSSSKPCGSYARDTLGNME